MQESITFIIGLWMARVWIWGTIALIVCFVAAPSVVPQQFEKKYLNAPYFDSSVVYFCESFYYRCFFVQVLICMLNIPWLARFRKAPDIAKDCPRWWLIVARVYFWLLVVPVYASFISLSVDCLFFSLCEG